MSKKMTVCLLSSNKIQLLRISVCLVSITYCSGKIHSTGVGEDGKTPNHPLSIHGKNGQNKEKIW